MQCPQCQAAQSNVYDTKRLGDFVQRLRLCQACGHRWRSYEEADAAPVKRRKPRKKKTGGYVQLSLMEASNDA